MSDTFKLFDQQANKLFDISITTQNTNDKLAHYSKCFALQVGLTQASRGRLVAALLQVGRQLSWVLACRLQVAYF